MEQEWWKVNSLSVLTTEREGSKRNNDVLGVGKYVLL